MLGYRGGVGGVSESKKDTWSSGKDMALEFQIFVYYTYVMHSNYTCITIIVTRTHTHTCVQAHLVWGGAGSRQMM